MITSLTANEIVHLVQARPEQAALDFKLDFVVPNEDEKRGELIKDITAIANASPQSAGFIIYGVDLKRPEPIVGVANRYDDASIQQLIHGKVEPRPEFLYYEVMIGTKVLAVIHVAPSRRRPFIVRKDIGRIRTGQIPIRRGSTTDGAQMSDLIEFFYGPTSGYFPQIIQQLGLDAQRLNAETAYLQELQRGIDRAESDMWATAGLRPPPK